MTAAGPRLVTLPDADAVARAGAEAFTTAARQAIEDRGAFTVCLAGGSTPAAMYDVLAADGPGVDWSAVRVWFGDERCVGPDHPESNYRLARDRLLEPAGVGPEQVFRMEGERDPEDAATRYGRLLKVHVPGETSFDLLFLGLGGDGHTASLFPGTAALAERKHRCVANFVPKLDAWRLTLTFPILSAAREIVMLVTGESKRDALAALLAEEGDARKTPARGVSPATGRFTVLADRVAAGHGVGPDRCGFA